MSSLPAAEPHSERQGGEQAGSQWLMKDPSPPHHHLPIRQSVERDRGAKWSVLVTIHTQLPPLQTHTHTHSNIVQLLDRITFQILRRNEKFTVQELLWLSLLCTAAAPGTALTPSLTCHSWFVKTCKPCQLNSVLASLAVLVIRRHW